LTGLAAGREWQVGRSGPVLEAVEAAAAGEATWLKLKSKRGVAELAGGRLAVYSEAQIRQWPSDAGIRGALAVQEVVLDRISDEHPKGQRLMVDSTPAYGEITMPRLAARSRYRRSRVAARGREAAPVIKDREEDGGALQLGALHDGVGQAEDDYYD